MKTASLFIVSFLLSVVAAVPMAQSDVDESALFPSKLIDENVVRQSALGSLSGDPSLELGGMDPSDVSGTSQSELPGAPLPRISQSDTDLPPAPLSGSRRPSTLGRFQPVSSEDGGIGSDKLYAQSSYDLSESAGVSDCIGANTCDGLATSYPFQGVTRHRPTACNFYGLDGSTSMVVALPAEFMGPEVYDANPYCNKQITINYRGRSVNAYVADKCRPGGCKGHNIIVSTSVMRALSLGSSLLRGISWSINPNISRRPIQRNVASSVSRQSSPNTYARPNGSGGGSRRQRVQHGTNKRPSRGGSGATAADGQKQQQHRVKAGSTSPSVGADSSPTVPGTQPSSYGGTSPGNDRTTFDVLPPSSQKSPPSRGGGGSSTPTGAGTSSTQKPSNNDDSIGTTEQSGLGEFMAPPPVPSNDPYTSPL